MAAAHTLFGMKNPGICFAILLALALSACDKPASVAQASNPAAQNRPVDPSLPTVIPTPVESPTAVRDAAVPLEPMTKKEEALAMPLPGQANDHSSAAMHPGKEPGAKPTAGR
jgi:uncharacterized lipoprotein